MVGFSDSSEEDFLRISISVLMIWHVFASWIKILGPGWTIYFGSSLISTFFSGSTMAAVVLGISFSTYCSLSVIFIYSFSGISSLWSSKLKFRAIWLSFFIYFSSFSLLFWINASLKGNFVCFDSKLTFVPELGFTSSTFRKALWSMIPVALSLTFLAEAPRYC